MNATTHRTDYTGALAIFATVLFVISLVVPVADARELAELDVMMLAPLAYRRVRTADIVAVATGFSAVVVLALRALTHTYFVTPVAAGHALAHWLHT